jgi:hypothetical protein
MAPNNQGLSRNVIAVVSRVCLFHHKANPEPKHPVGAFLLANFFCGLAAYSKS